MNHNHHSKHKYRIRLLLVCGILIFSLASSYTEAAVLSSGWRSAYTAAAQTSASAEAAPTSAAKESSSETTAAKTTEAKQESSSASKEEDQKTTDGTLESTKADSTEESVSAAASSETTADVTKDANSSEASSEEATKTAESESGTSAADSKKPEESSFTEETETISETEPTTSSANISPKSLTTSVAAAIKDTRSYILSVDTNPDKDSQWYVFSCARSGMSKDSSYFKTFYYNMITYFEEKDGAITSTQYSDYSKLILTLTALGYDATDIDGYNLLSYLADFSKVKKQGFNGPLWALLAVNCHPSYEIPEVEGVSEQTTIEGIISYLLSKEMDGGGWAFSGTTPDIDMTAMTIQALAPYYGKSGYGNVTAAIDRGLQVLGDQQNAQTGGFLSMSTENSESCAQVIVALSSLGIDCKKDARFVKEGNWPVYALMSYHVSKSGFLHVATGSLSKLATAQGLYALASYQRLKKGQTSLYDMSDMTLTAGPSPKSIKTESTDMDTKKETTKAAETTAKEKETTTAAESTTSRSNLQTAVSRTTAKGGGTLNITGGKTTTGTSAASDAAASADETSLEEESAAEELTEENSGGWAFTGEDYVPETSGEEMVSDEAALAAEAADMNAASETSSPALSLIFGFLGAFAGTLCALWIYRQYIKKKGK